MSETEKKTNLTDRQLKAIPHIVSSPTYTEGYQKAEINKTTLYKWLKEPEFKHELDRQRDEVAAEARVERDRFIITASDPAAATLFGQAIVDTLAGR
jgi:hypothetical protein